MDYVVGVTIFAGILIGIGVIGAVAIVALGILVAS